MNSRELFGMVALTGLLVVGLLAGLVDRVQAAPLAEAKLSPTSAGIDFGWLKIALSRPNLSIKQAPILSVVLPPHKPFLQETPVLTVTKTADPDPALAGGVLTYTIVVTGDSITNVTGVVITDTLDSRVSYQAASHGGNHSAGVVTWTVDEIAAGQAITRTVSVTVSQVTSGTLLSNTAEVISTEGASSTHTIATTVNAVADLAISKTNGQTQTVPGQVVTYTIVVSNSTGPSVVTGATVIDNFPAMLSGMTWICTASGGATCTAGGSNNIADTVDLPVGSWLTYTATGTVNPAAIGLLANTALVTVPTAVYDPVADNNSAGDIDTLAPQANLTITKTNNQLETVPGLTTTYTIVVSNAGPSVVTGATVIDNFPASLTNVNWTCSAANGGSCTATGPDNIDDTVNLPVGGSVTYVVTGAVSASATGQLTNTASVSTPAEVNDPNSSDNSAADTDTLTPRADLAISKTNNQLETVPGLTTTYTIIVSNSVGPSDISGAIVSDAFPFLTGVTWSCAGLGGGSCPADSGNGNLNHNVDLPVGSLVTFWVTGTVLADATGQLVNTAVVTVPAGAVDPNSSDNSATDTDTLTPRADLAISKSNGQSAVVPGEQTTYTIIVTNTGPSAVTGATVLDAFPSLNNVIWNCTGSGGGICPANGSGNLNQSVSLPVGSRVTFTATGTVDPAARGLLTNTATVTVPPGVTDPSPGNNSASDSDNLTPKADLHLFKIGLPSQVIAGNPLTYVFTVTNIGPSNATGVTLADNLPTGLIFQSATPSQGNCLGTVSISCDLGTIANGANATVTIQVTVDPSILPGTLINIANVLGVENDPIGGNNIASTQNSVIVETDLAISKTDAADPTLLGNPLTYTLAITNHGPSNAAGVVITDTLPATVTFVSAQSTLGNCSGTGPVTCTLGVMNRGSTATVTIVVNPLQTGLLSNLANVVGNQTDPTAANNSAAESTQVNAEADLVVSMTGSPNPVFPGNNLTYNITVVNKGPSPAVGAVVTATLPAGVSYVSATASPGSCSGTGPVSCNLGNLARNGTATATIVVKVGDATQGTLVNSASAASSRTDPVPGNNSATLNILVGAFKRVYLPIVFKPAPTELYVHNDNTGGNVTFIIRNYSTNAEVTRCIVANGATLPCDHDNDGSNIFPPGLYKVEVFAVCGSDAFDRIYDSGRQTTRVFCK